MKIALDYDQTYTLDPYFWDLIIGKSIAHGHDIRVVTIRHPVIDKITAHDIKIPIIYTNGVAKSHWCLHFEDWVPDVWIDDKPRTIDNNSLATPEALVEWRKTRL